ncbi:hypothetical protein LR48_Vigan10g080000 [Vigna angularis]|uniref:Uncharacterized protein n=1 Tax=Phaseolus angularis TaxID=3914 RepID=A0A0L9VIT4_PHAAN|nr:hypothetical protein LR48_Vigan10g080000 [Vigna angularis]
MKSSSISFFISIRENFNGHSSFSNDPLNFGDFSTSGTLLNSENDIPTLAFLSSILTVMGLGFGSALISSCRREGGDDGEEDARAAEQFRLVKVAIEVSGEKYDLAAVVMRRRRKGFSWCGLVQVAHGEGLPASMEDSQWWLKMTTICGSDGGGHGGLRLTTRLMMVEIGFGGGKVGRNGGKVGGDGFRVSI